MISILNGVQDLLRHIGAHLLHLKLIEIELQGLVRRRHLAHHDVAVGPDAGHVHGRVVLHHRPLHGLLLLARIETKLGDRRLLGHGLARVAHPPAHVLWQATWRSGVLSQAVSPLVEVVPADEVKLLLQGDLMVLVVFKVLKVKI